MRTKQPYTRLLNEYTASDYYILLKMLAGLLVAV